MFADPSILDVIASVAPALRQDEGAGGSAPPPRRRQRRGFSGSPRSAQSRSRSCPRQRRTKRALARPFPRPLKQPQPHMLLRWSAWTRESTEERGHRRPNLLPPPLRRSPCRASPPRPLKSVMPLRARQEPPPRRSKRSRRTRERPCRKASEAVRPKPLSLPVSRGWPPSRLATTLRTMRRPQRATPLSAGWRGRNARSMS
jgi:hypothetical protein